MRVKAVDRWEQQKYTIWRHLMDWGAASGCHQMPERSFFVGRYQVPVCARCTGVVIGNLVAVPVFLLLGYRRLIVVAGGLLMAADWGLQRAEICESNNIRRFVTGIAGGFAIMSTQLFLFAKLGKYLKRNDDKKL